MKELIIEAKTDTPGIIFKPEMNEFKIFGKSLPEDAKEFYDPILNYLRLYAEAPNPETVLEINLEYYNSASVRKLVSILNLFDKISKAGNKVEAVWLYEESDEVMQENGLDFQDIVTMPFKLKSYELDD
ncbi:MAG: DUF1987 domain-containing protein [Bacteroidota bacterium]|nr:DUF1987 domain-containing protein [Bacteroidota bacterium]